MSVYLAYQKKLEYFDHKNKANLVICEKNLESLRRRGHQSPESNKIWSVVQRMYNIQGRYGLAIAFKQLAVGTKLIVNVSGPILERFKIYLPEELKLKLMFQCYDWNLNIGSQ
ncbi:unnamed protein product [Orchesella dallaii]|uniref:Uncharacterized protein n=1 Tax=Orchesella dallaii TaxID=48710 RepID=A0ABP1RFW2_9HEXA